MCCFSSIFNHHFVHISPLCKSLDEVLHTISYHTGIFMNATNKSYISFSCRRSHMHYISDQMITEMLHNLGGAGDYTHLESWSKVNFQEEQQVTYDLYITSRISHLFSHDNIFTVLKGQHPSIYTQRRRNHLPFNFTNIQ